MNNTSDFVYPDFSNSLVNIPNTILSHFNIKVNKKLIKKSLLNEIKDSKKIVLFLADGLGYNLFDKWSQNNKFLKNIKQKGLVEKITTIYPSSTPAGITSINSGLTPLEHGLPDWNIYFRELGVTLETLPYKIIETDLQPKRKIKEDPKILFNQKTIFELLNQKNIPSFYFCPKGYNQNYPKAISKGAKKIEYSSNKNLLINLHKTLNKTSDKMYCFIYLPKLDSLEHQFSPNSNKVFTELNLISRMIEKDFINKLNKKLINETSIILTGDHGQIKVDPKKTIYLNQYPKLIKSLRTNSQNEPILPTGGARSVFLSIKETQTEKTTKLLKEKLKNKAQIIRLYNKMSNLLFGKGKKHKEFYNRLGNILIIPQKNNTVWYKYTKNDIFCNQGHHGGLSPDEMYIPLICFKPKLL